MADMNAEEIFLNAIEKSREDRAQYLQQVYAQQPELRAEVDSLLEAHDRSGGFLSRPLVAPPGERPELADDVAAQVGDQLGPYRLVREVGRGGMGVVFLASDNRLDRMVALKLLPHSRSQDTEWLRRFRREARSASSLNHPNILTIHEIGDAAGIHYIAAEFVDGCTLRDKLAQHGSLAVADALGFATQLASAMAAAHAAGIIHRDLKPENVMVRSDGLLKVLDFGLAKPADPQEWPGRSSAPLDPAMHFSSAPGIVVGTARYMSPEQLRGQAIDARSDIFSFGILLFQMLTGEHPFQAESAGDVMAAILDRAPRTLSEYRSDIPPPLSKLVFQCLSKDRDQRSSSAELLAELKQLQADHQATSTAPAAPTPATQQRADTGLALATTIRLAVDPLGEEAPQVRYARSGDVNIAYQVLGSGPIDLVFVMGWVSHLDWFWKEPLFSAFLRRLATFARVILFDKRGTGLSDRVPLNELPTLEQRMDDVRAVMDSVGSSRAVLCGVSEGGPMCSLFAATHPEKTIALVMIGCYARRLWAEDYPWGPTDAEREHFLEEIRHHWGGPVGIEDRAPSRANDPEFRRWWATYLRMGASPGAAVALTNMNAQIDVRPVLPSIQVPTLVIHRTDDRCLLVEEGRYLAEKIPGAKFVELPGADHLPFVGDADAILDEIKEFLTGVRHATEIDRLLATVLYIVIEPSSRGSGEIADNMTSSRFQALVEREAELFRGRNLNATSTSLVLTFDGPARAVRAGAAIRDLARRLGINVRIGVHTGACDMVEERVTGPAVDDARQIAQRASIGEVLLSDTVKNLVVGSGLEFVARAPLRFQTDGIEHQLYQTI